MVSEQLQMPYGPVTAAKRAGGWEVKHYEKSARLTNAQMLALASTAITVIPAPGTGFAIEVLEAHFVSDSSGGAYTESGDNIVLRYASSTTIITIETTGLITTGSVQYRVQRRPAAVFTPVTNTAIELFNSGSNFGGGNAANSFSIVLSYVIRPTVAFGSPVG